MKWLCAIGIVMAVPGVAGAADMPVKAPPATGVAPSALSWTGCYLGGHIGGGWGAAHWRNATGFSYGPGVTLFGFEPLVLDQQISGFIGGGQAGCRLQVAPNWVVGIDGDYSGAKIHRTDNQFQFVVPPGATVPTQLDERTSWLASTTGNIGYSFDRLLLYAKGGAAWAHSKYDVLTLPGSLPVRSFFANETRTGWIVGAGIEYALSNYWSTKLEYNYYDFGNRTTAFVTAQAPGGASAVDIAQRINAIKFGLNYNFWGLNSQTDASAAAAYAAASAQPAESTWHQTLQSEVRYFSWKSTRGFPTNLVAPPGNPQPITSPGKGLEVYTPYAMQLVGQPGDFKIEVLGRGGWVRASQTTLGTTGSVSTATDTVGSATVTYMGWQGFQPFASLELNLPTGQAALPGPAANARMDPDLVDISTFGEGFNIGPTLGFNLPITENFIFSMSTGYTRRGAFTRETTLTPSGNPNVLPANIDPGNVFTVTSSLGYSNGPFTGKVTGTISSESMTRENGLPFVKPGRRYLVTGTGSYTWQGEHAGVTTLNASAAHGNRNDVLFVFFGAPTTLFGEPFNTNSNLYQTSLEHLFAFDKLAIGPTGSFLFRDNNGYNSTTLQFVPQKERWSAGLVGRYAANNTLTFSTRVEHVWTRENDNPAPGDSKFSILAQGPGLAFTIPVISSDGWQFVFGATASF